MGEIAFQHVTRRYGAHHALQDVSLQVRDGELLVLMGPAGSGKTALLRLIAGLERPDDGEIWMDGKRIDRLPAGRRDVAMVFSSYALYEHMTVRQNLAFPLECAGMDRRQASRHAQAVAATLGFTDMLDRRPAQLPGRDRQRVAVARAIMRRPGACLLDDPLARLDEKERPSSRLELEALQEMLGMTMLYATRDHGHATGMGHRLAVLAGGVLQQYGTPSQVYEHPANLVVAELTGWPAMNLLQLQVSVDAGSMRLLGDGIDLWLSPDALHGLTGRLSSTGRVVLGVRPEDLHIGRGANGPSLLARVQRVETMGRQSLAHLDLGGTGLTAWVTPGTRLGKGELVSVGVEQPALRFFDPHTGVALTKALPPGGGR